ncbi:unnamed protein product [Chondrus crispus]|uniref:Uncharacterized protein n=1 Tax=Chondrus crispus TaxID=2769 RepID=R7QF77_CHOCR|nr:unnamed protein product [Chondrus crispus]CDF36744.1 unnamed protein product [Chondrus crispus]|eukprot:XP_005716563.1 unnamed protein product [Chondrus crispus]
MCSPAHRRSCDPTLALSPAFPSRNLHLSHGRSQYAT